MIHLQNYFSAVLQAAAEVVPWFLYNLCDVYYEPANKRRDLQIIRWIKSSNSISTYFINIIATVVAIGERIWFNTIVFISVLLVRLAWEHNSDRI